MRKPLLLATVLVATPVLAQTAHNTNFGIKSRVIHAGIAADATYAATSLNLPLVDWTGYGHPITTLGQNLYGYSGLTDSAISYYINNREGVDRDITRLAEDLGTSPANVAFFAFSAIMALDVARSGNTWYRVYQTYVPVTATYTITANLIGGFDHPHNKIDIFSNGTQVFHVDESPASNRSMSYSVALSPGDHIIIVGLGAGSTYFHDAGRLASISASGSFAWTTGCIVAESQTPFVQALPQIGASAEVSVSVPPSLEENVEYPISFGIGTVRYSRFRPAQALLDPCKSPDAVLYRIIQGGGQVWFGDMSQTSAVALEGGRKAVFGVVRHEDVQWE